ncbi:MAG: CxxC-x17-CxxC domain-containing protein, partial [Nanoarchaeota archaeon]
QGRGGFGGRSRDGGRGFGGDRGGFSRDRNSERRSVEMYDATCSKCNKKCQVPFRPTGSKPVFCSECFGQQGDRGDRGNSFSRDNNFSHQSSPTVDLSGINAKLDKIIAILQELELDVVDEDMTDSDEDSEDEIEEAN